MPITNFSGGESHKFPAQTVVDVNSLEVLKVEAHTFPKDWGSGTEGEWRSV